MICRSAATLGAAAHAGGPAHFLAGVRMMTSAGDVDAQSGMAAQVYFATRSMTDDYFYDADGELLIVPQQGALRFVTEFGGMEAAPGEIGVIPRGVKFKAELVGRRRRAAISARTTARLSLCPSAGRSAPIVSPTPAIS